MAIDDQDPSEPLLRQRVENVAQDRHVRFDTERDRSWKRAKVWRDPVRQHGEDGHAQRLRGFNGEALCQNAVHAEAQVSVLFCAAQWQDCAIVALQIFFHHHPIHFADSHITSSRYRFLASQPTRTTRGSSGPREMNSGNSSGCKIPARISRLSTIRGPGRAKYALASTT